MGTNVGAGVGLENRRVWVVNSGAGAASAQGRQSVPSRWNASARGRQSVPSRRNASATATTARPAAASQGSAKIKLPDGNSRPNFQRG